MRPIYKWTKVMKEHCPECKEVLQGNNSSTFPWMCRCGVWRAESAYPFNGEYKLEASPFRD